MLVFLEHKEQTEKMWQVDVTFYLLQKHFKFLTKHIKQTLNYKHKCSGNMQATSQQNYWKQS